MISKSKVFLSSTQFGDEFKVEREVLPVLFRKEPLCSIFELWKIEEQSAGISVDEQYIRNVRNSHLVILLIDSIIRDAVRNEIQEAKRKEIPVYTFIKENKNRSEDASDYITKIRTFCTTSNYSSIEDLCKKIEESLLSSFYAPKTRKEEIAKDREDNEFFDLNERSYKIALYLLNDSSKKISKEKIIPLLIGFYLSKNNMELLDLKKVLPISDKKLIDDSLAIMIEKLDIVIENNKYCLAEHKKIEFEKIIKTIDDEEREVKHKIVLKYIKSVDISEEQFINYLEKCLSIIIYKTTTKVNDFFSVFNDNAYDSEILNKIILDSIILCGIEDKDYLSWQKIIIDILISEDVKTIKWVESIHKSFWFLSALGLEERTNILFRENINDYNIFFDSHIVLRGLLNSGDDSQLCKDIIERGKKLNVNMYISEPIFQEVKNTFEQADNMVSACHGDFNRIIELLSNLDIKHDIIDAYLIEKSKNNYLEWSEFISQYYSLQDDSVLITYLEKVSNIKFYDFEFDEGQRGDIQAFAESLTKKRSRNIQRKIDASDNPEKEKDRQTLLRLNEAKQLEIIYELRNKIPNYWFVTFDKFIYEVCVSIYETGGRDKKYFPCFIKPAKWLEILTISDKDIKSNIFNEILMSDSIHHAVNSIEASIITEILSNNIDTKIKEKSVLNNMFKEAVNKAVIMDIKNEIRNSNPKTVSAIENIDEIIKGVLYEKLSKYDETFKQQNMKIQQVVKERDKEKKAKNYFRAQLTRTTKKRK